LRPCAVAQEAVAALCCLPLGSLLVNFSYLRTCNVSVWQRSVVTSLVLLAQCRLTHTATTRTQPSNTLPVSIICLCGCTCTYLLNGTSLRLRPVAPKVHRTIKPTTVFAMEHDCCIADFMTNRQDLVIKGEQSFNSDSTYTNYFFLLDELARDSCIVVAEQQYKTVHNSLLSEWAIKNAFLLSNRLTYNAIARRVKLCVDRRRTRNAVERRAERRTTSTASRSQVESWTRI